MTLERERDMRPRSKLSGYGKKRKQAAIRRAHHREMNDLANREEAGLGLTDRQKERLEVLRETYE